MTGPPSHLPHAAATVPSPAGFVYALRSHHRLLPVPGQAVPVERRNTVGENHLPSSFYTAILKCRRICVKMNANQAPVMKAGGRFDRDRTTEAPGRFAKATQIASDR